MEEELLEDGTCCPKILMTALVPQLVMAEDNKEYPPPTAMMFRKCYLEDHHPDDDTSPFVGSKKKNELVRLD